LYNHVLRELVCMLGNFALDLETDCLLNEPHKAKTQLNISWVPY